MATQTILEVRGMTCPSCIRHIDGALRDVDGVEDVQVRFQEKRVLVQHDTLTAPVPALVEALEEAGYASSCGTATASDGFNSSASEL